MIITSASGHLVQLDLHDDGTLALTPANRVAALWLFNTPSVAPVFLQPDQVSGITDTLPSPDGVMLGWLELATPGDPVRVPYRLRRQPYIRYLLREAAALGWPSRCEVGQSHLPEPVLTG
jgi:hypothetical protein